jgi:hypothetical protein
VPNRHRPEDDEYRREKVRQRMRDRRNCLGCLLFVACVIALTLFLFWLAAGTPGR